MIPDDPDSPVSGSKPDDDGDDDLAQRLSAYDERLRRGAPPGAEQPSTENDAPGLDTSSLHDCLHLLERAWPRGLSADNPAIPTRIGRFQLERVLGVGGYGIVYLATDPTLDRKVALKVPRLHSLSNAKLRERFKREARAAAALDHPNIVPTHETGEAGPVCYIASAYCPGPNLAEWLKAQTAPVPVRLAAAIVTALAEAVEYSHSRGVLHRDLKPSNVLLAPRETLPVSAAKDELPWVPRLTDFGLAKLLGEDLESTAATAVVGTPSYMAPEQTGGAADQIGAGTDVYGLGVILYDLLTGRPPFEGTSVAEVFDQVRHREPVSPRVLRPGVPRDLEIICLKCLEKTPASRFKSAAELTAELKRHLNGEPIHSRPIGGLARLGRWCRRQPAKAALVGVSMLGVFALVGGLFVHASDVETHNAELGKVNNNLNTANTDLTDANDKLSRLTEDLQKAVVTSQELQKVAEQREQDAKDRVYAADIRRASVAMKHFEFGVVKQWLNRHIPAEGEVDRRGFEWWYLRHSLDDTGYTSQFDPCQPIARWSPDDRLLAIVKVDGRIEVQSKDKIGRLASKLLDPGPSKVNGVSFSSDSTVLCAACDDGTIRLWDPLSGESKESIKVFESGAQEVLFRQRSDLPSVVRGEGPEIAMMGAGLDNRAYVARKLDGHQTPVRAMALARNGLALVSIDSDAILIWDLALPPPTTAPKRVELGDARPIAIATLGDLLAISADDNSLRLWSVAERRELTSRKVQDVLPRLAMHPNGKLIAGADTSGQIRIWTLDEAGNFTVDEPKLLGGGAVHILNWSADGTGLLYDAKSSARQFLQIKHIVKPVPARAIQPRTFEGISDFTFLGDGDLLATAGDSGLTCWIQKPRFLGSAFFHKERCSAVAASPDGKSFAAGAEDGDVIISQIADINAALNVKQAAKMSTRLYTWGFPEPVVRQGKLGGFAVSLAYSTDSKTLLALRRTNAEHGPSPDDSLSLLSADTGNLLRSMDIPFCQCVRLIPASRRVALATSTELMIADLELGSMTWKQPLANITSLDISSDGRFLASVSADRVLAVWDLPNGKQRYRQIAHQSRINSVAFSPDDRTLATASASGEVKLWQARTGEELMTLYEDAARNRIRGNEECLKVLFSRDGRNLACMLGTARGEVIVFGEFPLRR